MGGHIKVLINIVFITCAKEAVYYLFLNNRHNSIQNSQALCLIPHNCLVHKFDQ